MKLNTKITKALELFEVRTRIDGTQYTVCNADQDSKLYDSIREAHDDKFPSDWIYSTYMSCLETLSNYDIDNIDKLEEVRSEAVDSMVDIYTAELTAWLHESIDNVYWLDEALSTYGSDTRSGFDTLSMAQYLAIDEVMGYVISYLSK